MLSVNDQSPHSGVYLALLIQEPDVDVVQPIYVREGISRGVVQKIAETSLRSFLMNSPLTKNEDFFDVVQSTEIKGKGIISLHYYLPRDQYLQLGVIDSEFRPISILTHAVCLELFSSPGIQMSFEAIQSTLERWPKRFFTACALFVKYPDIYKEQNIYFRETLSSGPIKPMIKTSLRSFLETTPVVASGACFEFVKSVGDEDKGGEAIGFTSATASSSTPASSFDGEEESNSLLNPIGESSVWYLPRDDRLKLGVLDNKLNPIGTKWQIHSLGIFSELGKQMEMDSIQSTLERWPKQRPSCKSSSDSRIPSIPPHILARLRAQRSSSGQMERSREIVPTPPTSQEKPTEKSTPED